MKRLRAYLAAFRLQLGRMALAVVRLAARPKVARNAVATLALGCVFAGLWIERPSVALIVLGGAVLACMVADMAMASRVAAPPD